MFKLQKGTMDIKDMNNLGASLFVPPPPTHPLPPASFTPLAVSCITPILFAFNNEVHSSFTK